MDKLLRKLGISEETIREMKEMCPYITELRESELIEKINILKILSCNDTQIRDIISSNPFYLDRIDTDVNKLIDKLKAAGIDRVDILLEENPYALNLDAFEIDDLMTKMKELGFVDMASLLADNPYILNLAGFEIEDYIRKREEGGELREDIIEDMSEDPSIFFEV